MSDLDWWCPNCKVALGGNRVTNDERCDTCGCAVYPEGSCPSCSLKDAEIARLRPLEENNRALLEIVKRQEGEIVALKKVADEAEKLPLGYQPTALRTALRE